MAPHITVLNTQEKPDHIQIRHDRTERAQGQLAPGQFLILKAFPIASATKAWENADAIQYLLLRSKQSETLRWETSTSRMSAMEKAADTCMAGEQELLSRANTIPSSSSTCY